MGLLSQENLKNALQHFGATEKESEVYIFLAKHGTLGTGQIAKQMKKNRGLVYRILSSLERKGLVEATLESPTRFAAVPLEKVIDAYVKARQVEIAQVERTKEDLLEDWKRISQTEVEPKPENFTVVEGNQKIYRKIAEMIEKTENEFSTVSLVSDLVRAEQFGVFDFVYSHPRKNELEFRFLTDVNQQDLKAFELLRAKLKSGLRIKARNPDLGLALFPRMVIRDSQEILFFISPRTQRSAKKQEVCISTNCDSLVQSFTGVFAHLWRNSTDIDEKIAEIETGKPALQTCIIKNAETAIKKYEEIIDLAQKEIIMLTSSEGLIDIGNKPALLKNCSKRGISIKIMAPITTKNLEVANQLSKHFEVRHVPVSYLKTTIVDAKHLLQSKETFEDDGERNPRFDTCYTNDHEYISNRQRILANLWKTSKTPSMVTLATVSNYSKSTMSSRPSQAFHKIIKRINGPIIVKEEYDSTKKLKEKDIINLYLNAARHPETSFSGGITRYYGFIGQAIVSPPSNLNLPEMLFIFLHYEKNSRFGSDNILQVFVKQKSPSSSFLPVVYISDNPKKLAFHRRTFAGCFLNDNFLLSKKNQIQIQMHGRNLFCGWTIEVPLKDEYVLPPGSILLEAYGEVKPNIIEMQYPSGYKLWTAYNGIEAFVTYFHPFAKYSGPGTDSLILRNIVQEMYIP